MTYYDDGFDGFGGETLVAAAVVCGLIQSLVWSLLLLLLLPEKVTKLLLTILFAFSFCCSSAVAGTSDWLLFT